MAENFWDSLRTYVVGGGHARKGVWGMSRILEDGDRLPSETSRSGYIFLHVSLEPVTEFFRGVTVIFFFDSKEDAIQAAIQYAESNGLFSENTASKDGDISDLNQDWCMMDDSGTNFLEVKKVFKFSVGKRC